MPPIYKDGWQSAIRWPVSQSFVGGVIDDQLLLWGGYQIQEKDSYWTYPPNNFVYSFTLNEGWRRINATGDVHLGHMWAASTAINGLIYIFGGDNRDYPVNDISTLSANGHFTRLQPSGDVIPSPRWSKKAWSYDDQFYCFGGMVKRIDETRKEDFMEFGSYHMTNKTFKFDTKTSTWTCLAIRGVGPSLRTDFAIARLGHRVFIQGGNDYYFGFLSDFFMLDLKTMKKTEIRNAGISAGLARHSLNPVSLSQLLLVGGNPSHDKVSNRVAIFDVSKSEWTEEATIPTQFGGSEGGLQQHQAFETRNETAVTVICVGGYVGMFF